MKPDFELQLCSVSQTLNHYIALPPNGKLSSIPAAFWFANQRKWVDYMHVLCGYSVEADETATVVTGQLVQLNLGCHKASQWY